MKTLTKLTRMRWKGRLKLPKLLDALPAVFHPFPHHPNFSPSHSFL
jgi:hypothetical protein